MQARGADGHSGEREVCDRFGCLLQCSHHLELGIVNMAEEGILILYTGQKTDQKLPKRRSINEIVPANEVIDREFDDR